MSDSDDASLKLVGMVYDAALDEQKWPSFLDAFASAVGGSSSMLRSVDLQTNAAGFVASVGYDPAWQAAYCKYFAKMDFVIRFLYQLPAGEVRSNDQVFSLSEQRKTEFYNDYYVPQDKPHAMGTLLIKDGSHTLLFSSQRGKRAGAFGVEEVRLMNIIAPHVARAVQVQRKVSNLTVEKESALGALDQLRVGVILSNSLGVPLFVNRAAETMLATGNSISVSHDRLGLSSASQTALLYKLIANAALGTRGMAAGGDMRIALSDSAEYLHCLVVPVAPEFSARWNLSLGSDCVAIFLSKPSGLQLSPQRLAVLYGLTPAEARLVAQLAALKSVEQAAESLGVAVATARSHLKSVFIKTGARSQSELLMLLATGALAHCSDE